MRLLLSIAVSSLLFFFPTGLLGKRVARVPVNPIVHNGIKYSAEGDGISGYVLATEVASEKELWKLKVFHIHIKPWLEEDNQWIFINGMELTGDSLLVRDEKSRCYSINLTKRNVKKVRCP